MNRWKGLSIASSWFASALIAIFSPELGGEAIAAASGATAIIVFFG